MATQNALEQAYTYYFSIVDMLAKFESDDEDEVDAAY